MKKVLLFLVLLLIPCIVMADTEVFKETGSIKNGELIMSMSPYKDGYIIVSVHRDETGGKEYLRYIDKNGNTIKQSEFAGAILFVSAFADENNNIYVFTEERYLCTLGKYNEDLEKQSELSFENCTTPYYGEIDAFNNTHPARINNNYIYIYDTYYNNIIKTNLDLSSSERIEVTDARIKELFPEAYYYNKVEETLPDTLSLEAFNISGDYLVANIFDTSTSCQPTDENCNAQYIRVYDKEINLIKEFIIPAPSNDSSSEVVLNGYMIKGYFILSSYYMIGEVNIPNEFNANNKFKIYDSDWNLIQTIEKENVISTFLYETENGFISSNLLPLVNSKSETIESIMFFSLVSSIETPTIDHGRVIIPADAAAGETVTIEVKPDKGFTLSELTVLDANGNKVPVTNNTFVMGTSKVTILATFTPENPNTGNFYVILICLIAAISGIVSITQKKKLDFLK